MNLNEWTMNQAAGLLNENLTEDLQEIDLNDPNWYSKMHTKGDIHTAFCNAFEKEKKENPVPLTWCRRLYSKGFDTFQFGCEDGRYGFDVYDVPKEDPYYGKANIRVFVHDSKIEDPQHRTVSCFYVKKDTLPNEVKSIFKITKRLFNDGVEKFNKDNGCVIRKNESVFQLPIPNSVKGKLINE